MPIVMDLGFGEDGDTGDRGTVSKQATRGHEVYPGSGPRRENPTLVCLLLITTEPVITGVRRWAWRCVCESMREIDLGHALLAFIYGEARSQVPIRVGYKLYSNSSLELSLSRALGTSCPYGLYISRTVIGVMDPGRSSSGPSIGQDQVG